MWYYPFNFNRTSLKHTSVMKAYCIKIVIIIIIIIIDCLSLQREPVPSNYSKIKPEYRHIYRFMKTLFNAAQLTAECAIITLVSLVFLAIQNLKMALKKANILQHTVFPLNNAAAFITKLKFWMRCSIEGGV